MPTEDTTPPPQSPPSRPRRSSLAGQTFAELFGSGRNSFSRGSQDNSASSSPPNGKGMGPITTAAAQAQQRRLSLSTVGLNGSPNQTSPFNNFRSRRDSLSSANSGSIDESAIEDDNLAAARDPQAGATPSSPFARRMSFGAQALRDVRNSKSGSSSNGAGGGGGNSSGSAGQNGRSPPAIPEENSTASLQNSNAQKLGGKAISARSDKGREGFNWSENLRTRAERTSVAGPPPGGMPFGGNRGHERAKSVATMEQPTPGMPKPQKRPDHFQERILKGDFYMD